MARYTGPKHKLARRVGINLLDKTSNSLQRRLNIPPGVHGRKRKKRLSEYGLQMREKQKAKIMYGVLERQLKTIVQTVKKRKGETGEMILGSLETRLDNMVYRLGLAKTRYMARQMVTHGHVLVADKKINVPSYRAKIGEKISISDKMKKNSSISESMEDKENNIMPFLKKNKFEGELTRMPKRDDLEVPFDLQMIIEYYSR
ncbi:30S ribosomal protein S4 [Patescibacteria group bacterium]|nr:30S ribosomal protein S4 [Patescibacteria group bacterium]